MNKINLIKYQIKIIYQKVLNLRFGNPNPEEINHQTSQLLHSSQEYKKQGQRLSIRN